MPTNEAQQAKIIKWGCPIAAVIASVAFQWFELEWASGFASGAAMVMFHINLSTR